MNILLHSFFNGSVHFKKTVVITEAYYANMHIRNASFSDML